MAFHRLLSNVVVTTLALCLLSEAGSISTPSARASNADPLNTTITLDYGTFIGTSNTTSGILSFKGVRYADAPTGDNRFRAPISPPTTQLGTVDASNFADICIQATSTSVTGTQSEDCLFGNIYVPIGTTPDSQLPVLVYFHGGGFQAGDTTSFFPDLLLDTSAEPMIFATFAYRLGAFGFLGGPEVFANGDGNAGLLDQRAALRWVQTYISAFGGNSGNVTIWGESAGAGAIMFHLIATGGDNEGLFTRAIGDSASLSFLPPYTDGFIETLYQQLAINAGCGGVTDSLACLRAANVNALANASSVTLKARPAALFPFAPSIDGTFLTERTTEAFANGRFAQVPVSIGSNTNEGNNWSEGLPTSSGANVGVSGATSQTVFNFLAGQFPNITQETFSLIEEQYPITSFNNSLELQTSAIYGEARYICTALLITGAVTNFSNTAYQYRYDNPDAQGFTVHGSDLTAFFSFSNPSLPLFTAMRQYFTSFVTGGVPVATGESNNEATWEPVNTATGTPRILFHPDAVAMEVDDALVSRCEFWRTTDVQLQR
ncbi:alpha/beta-hydrolase [Stereum hirsutum FP-91666 SS1]|uniref:alpha/beta-hydrolase n=1 Tax=Stereum hirsutum (strain FP-91666) TaxID=721885 RepID=UPI000444A0FD|nr:alpha/beta-hydrolase [Stereum hirsutum FP-91666 SS1]EIM84192.1 alpha/beta-hydrolase [Stereum hirsutum FP-91666 SS1]